MTLYIDLDGPLLDVSLRYHEVHRSVVSDLGGIPLTKSIYWRLKRAGWTEQAICEARHPGLDPARYLELFVQRIESAPFLAMDRAVEGAVAALDRLHGPQRLVVATLRRRGAPMRAQLADLGLLGRLDGVLQAEDNDGSWRIKAELIGSEPDFDKESLLVGDTEAEVRAACRLGIPAVGVCNGLRDPRVLKAAGPCTLIASIVSLPDFVETRAGSRGGARKERSCARW